MRPGDTVTVNGVPYQVSVEQRNWITEQTTPLVAAAWDSLIQTGCISGWGTQIVGGCWKRTRQDHGECPPADHSEMEAATGPTAMARTGYGATGASPPGISGVQSYSSYKGLSEEEIRQTARGYW